MPSLLFRIDRWLLLKSRWLMLSATVQWWWWRCGSAPGLFGTEHNRDAGPAGRPGLDPRTVGDSDRAELLRRRMGALNLDAAELARLQPHVLRDFERLCAECKSRGRCVRELDEDLARNPADPASQGWIDYCPNAAMLNMLSAVRAAENR